jgi:hypothetical protein
MESRSALIRQEEKEPNYSKKQQKILSRLTSARPTDEIAEEE